MITKRRVNRNLRQMEKAKQMSERMMNGPKTNHHQPASAYARKIFKTVTRRKG